MNPAPSMQVLENYADILVNFALNDGRGVQKNEVVFLQVPESAKPLLITLYQKVLQAKAHPIVQYLPDNLERQFFENATSDQIKFFPAAFMKGKVKQANHSITIIAETDKHELEGIDPKVIMEKSAARKPYLQWLNQKENEGKYTWTLALYPTPAMAKEANLTLTQAWDQVIKACYLDDPHPLEKWRSIFSLQETIKQKLNSLPITALHLESYQTDLWIKIDQNHRFVGGSGRNIPSFEIFTSPDWRGTSGHIFFDLPLYRYGYLIKDIYLEFKNGLVTKATASKGQKVLEEMIAVKNANKVGEFSLTDIRFSRIDTFMAETLYDENYGGKYGNTHLALGSSYQECFPGPVAKVKKSQWRSLGYNTSTVHTDIIATANRTVTAVMADGRQMLIYKDGQFVIS